VAFGRAGAEERESIPLHRGRTGRTRTTVRTEKDRWTAFGNGVGLFRSGALGAARIRCPSSYRILNGALSGLFQR